MAEEILEGAPGRPRRFPRPFGTMEAAMKRGPLVFALLVGFLSSQPAESTICVNARNLHFRQLQGVVVAAPVDGRVDTIPGAVVRITRDTFQAETISDEDGYLAFADLPPGNYSLEVSLEGFLSASADLGVRKHGRADHVVLVHLTHSIHACSWVDRVSWKVARELQRESNERRGDA